MGSEQPGRSSHALAPQDTASAGQSRTRLLRDGAPTLAAIPPAPLTTVTASFSRDSPKTMMNKTSLTWTSSNTARTATGSTAAIRLPNRRKSSSPTFRSPGNKTGVRAFTGQACGPAAPSLLLPPHGPPPGRGGGAAGAGGWGAASGCGPGDRCAGTTKVGTQIVLGLRLAGVGTCVTLLAFLPWFPQPFKKGGEPQPSIGDGGPGFSPLSPLGLADPSWLTPPG